MKILHVISGGDTGGAKTHLLSLIKKLQNTETIKIICFVPGEFYKEALSLGYDVVLLKQKTRFDLKVVKQIITIIKNDNFDILHCHGARANFIALFIKKHIDIPFITTVHSDFNQDFANNFIKNLFFTPLNRIALKKFDYFIAVSDELKMLLNKNGIDSSKIFVVNNGVEFNKETQPISREDFCKKYSFNCSLNDTWVGIAARFHIVKGHKIFLTAAKEVLKTHPNTTFLLAGDGDEKQNILSLIKDFGLEEKIIWIGFCKNIYEFLNVIDINVLSSFTEGLPYVVLESAACKTPMISTDVGAIPKVIQNNYSGLLFKPGDSKTLASHIVNLIENKDLRKKLGENLYQVGLRDFSIEAMTTWHIDLYNKIKKSTV